MKEFPHAGAAKRDARAEDFTFAQLEVGDGLLRVGERWTLTGDLLDFVDGVVDGDLAVGGFAHAGGHDDFFETRNLMGIGVAELLGESRHHLVLVVLQ